VILQFAWLAYDPLAQLPRREDREAGERMIGTLASFSGPVFVPGHPYLLRLAGKPGHVHYSALYPTLVCGTPDVRDSLQAQLRDALDGTRFDALVLDSDRWLGLIPGERYRFAGGLLPDDAFWPVTGARLRPERLYVPR
jgi:hypothetical protein